MVVSSTEGGRRRVSWVVLDQAVSSIGNFGLGLLVARSSSPAGFGAFGIAFSLYLLLVAASRAVCSEPLLVRHSDSSPEERAAAVRRSTGTALTIGLLAGPTCALAALALPAPTDRAVLALAVTLPGLLVQDAWRYAFFAQGLPARAVVNDIIWTAASLGGALWLVRSGDPSVGVLILAWGAAGTLSGAAGILQAGLRPLPGSALRWWGEHRDLAGRFLGEVGVAAGATNLALLLIGLTTSLQVVGALRGAEILLGPVRLLAIAAPAAAIPELVRLRWPQPGAVVGRCTLLGAALVAVTGAWSLVVHLLPDDIGRQVLGPTWSAARDVVGIVTLDIALIGIAVAATVGLRALAAARRSLLVRVIQAPLTVVVPVLAARTGARGGAWGYVAVSTIAAVVWWYHLRAAAAAAPAERPAPGSRL